MAFAVLSLSQLVHSFNMRSAKPVVGHGMLKNRWLNLSFLICAALMAGVIVLPPAAALFGTAALTLPQWGIVAALSLTPLLLCEIEKRFLRGRAEAPETKRPARRVFRIRP